MLGELFMINLLALAPSNKFRSKSFLARTKQLAAVAAKTTTVAMLFFADFPFEMRTHAHTRINFANEVFHIQFHLFHCSIGLPVQIGTLCSRIFVSLIGSFVGKNGPEISIDTITIFTSKHH